MSAATCAIVGDGGSILTSATGGASWALRTNDTNQNLSGVACMSASACVAVGQAGLILRGAIPGAAASPPDVSLTKTHSGSFVVGQPATYTLRVSNAAGAGPTTGQIAVTDTLPNGLSFVSGAGAGWTCSASGRVVTCTSAGPLAAGASSALTLAVGVGAAAAPQVTNIASVSTPGESNTANNTSAPDQATVLGACTVRPPVGVRVEQIGPGVLRATLTAGTTGQFAGNALQSLRLTRLANATVDVQGGPANAPLNTVIPLGAAQQPLVLIVRRAAPGPFTAQLVVRDACDDWPTLVGGGGGVS